LHYYFNCTSQNGLLSIHIPQEMYKLYVFISNMSATLWRNIRGKQI